MIGIRMLLCLLLLTLSAACDRTDGTESEDVLTQSVISKDKIPVTVLVKYAFSINAFERAAEKRFAQLDLIQVGNFTRDRGIVEYGRRLEHDDLTDIVMTWPLDVGEQHWENRLLDLSSMPFTSRYNTAMLNSIARDGKLYYLPGPAQVRGIVYNKTLFKEKGWSVPHDFDSFVELCRTIEASGMRSIQLGFKNAEVLDTAFVGFSYGNCFSTPADAQWRTDYNKGRGSFKDQFTPALDTFQAMMDAGIWKKDDLDIDYARRETMLFSRQCAMAEDSVLMARMGHALTGTTDEFALMPFFTPGSPSDWARLYMVCYIGLNKHLAEPQNKLTYNLVLQLMDYISTPEGQAALAGDTGAMYSSVKGVPAPNIPEIADLAPTLSHGRYAVFPELQNAQQALRQGLAGMLEGTFTQDDVSRMVDRQNQNPPPPQASEPIGMATEDFTIMETGNFLTDAMRAKAGTDIAVFLDNGKDGKYNGKGISARFYKGPQTQDDVLRVLPDMKRGEAGTLQIAKMTGANLIRTLEHALSVDNGVRGWFYYFSGLKMSYAPAAAPGTRIGKITDADGKPIDEQRIYTVAVMEQTIPRDAALSVTDTDTTIQALLTEAIRSRKAISPAKDGRFAIREP